MTATENKKLSFPALTAMVLGSMIGAGIFMMPARFAAAAGVYGTLVSWLIAGSGMLMLAFVFQQLAIRKPKLDAGIFAYAKAGFGDYTGFVAAIGFWASACAGNVTYLVLINSTLGSVAPLAPIFGKGDTWWAFLFSTALIWLLFWLIVRGISQAAFINTIATCAKIIPIVVFIIMTILYFDPATFAGNLTGTVGGAVSAGSASGAIGSASGAGGAIGSAGSSLIAQLRSTMLLTVFAFLGIEGASVYSRYARKRQHVGWATVLGFASVLALLMMVSVLPFGILPRETIANLSQPSVAGVMEALWGAPGGTFISVGLIISISGALLAWTLMAAEVLFSIAKGGDVPMIIRQTNKVQVPHVALFLSSVLTQVILLTTMFASGALNYALDLSGAMALFPYLTCGAYALKIALTRDGYTNVAAPVRGKELIFALLSTFYSLFLLLVGGLKYIPLATLLIAPATLLFVYGRRQAAKQIFTPVELGVLALVGALFVTAIVGLSTGFIAL